MIVKDADGNEYDVDIPLKIEEAPSTWAEVKDPHPIDLWDILKAAGWPPYLLYRHTTILHLYDLNLKDD